MSLEEFHELIHIIKIRFERAYEPGVLATLCPSLFSSKACVSVSAAVRSPGFDVAIDVALVLAAVALILEQLNVFGGESADKDGRPDSFWNVLELVFCASTRLPSEQRTVSQPSAMRALLSRW